METKELICVNCPKGCRITVTLADGKVQSITGNSCPKGAEYAAKETTRPERILTSTVRIEGGLWRVLPVITSGAIPLDQMEAVMKTVRTVRVEAPVAMNQVLVENINGLGVDLIASRSMEKASA
jgi:CxxC motif-containing protein